MSTKFNKENLLSMCIDFHDVKFTFVTQRYYSAFQLAKALKIENIVFWDNFKPEFLGYGLKSNIKVFIDKSLVNNENRDKLAKFARGHYNPVELPNSTNLMIVASKGIGQVYDVSCTEIPADSMIFYSNMKNTQLPPAQHKIVGFSADTSIFNGSKSPIKQIRLTDVVPKKKNIFKQYEISQMSGLLSNSKDMDFHTLKFMIGTLESVKSNILFKQILSNLNEILPKIKSLDRALNSFTKKELSLKVKMDDSRKQRVAKGSQVPVELISGICNLVDKFRTEGITKMMSQMSSVNPEFSKFSKMFQDMMKK